MWFKDIINFTYSAWSYIKFDIFFSNFENAEDKEKVSEMEADAETASFSNMITSVVSRLTEIDSLIKAFDGCAGVFHTSAFVDPAGVSGYSVCFIFIFLCTMCMCITMERYVS